MMWRVPVLSWLAVFLGITVRAEPGVVLKEVARPGSCTQVRIDLTAEGLFRPGLPPGAVPADAKMPKPLSVDIATRLILKERHLNAGSEAEKEQPARASVKALRWVVQAASAINGEIRPMATVLRPGLSLLVAERKSAEEAVVVVSPAGPMTRAELELVEGLGDPLVLPELLPDRPVDKGQSWKLPDSVVFTLTDYDELKSSTLEATLKELDDKEAQIQIRGEVQGSARGGAGTITCKGTAHFDRMEGLVDRLEVNRIENRQAGPVEAGLEVKSTLKILRRPARLASELSDEAMAKVPLETSPQRQLLQLISPDGKYNVLHDRQWHTYWDDPKLIVLKRMEKGKVIAQCNLTAGPPAGKGKHQDLDQFRDDVRRALGQRFVQFLGAGEVDGDPAGGFRYKLAVQGREGDLGVLWYYYLLASPEGDQVLATFTLAEEDAKTFGQQDLEIIGSLQWSPATEKTP
jgi:hypothetical protein